MRWGWWHFKRRSGFFHWIPWQQKAWKNRPFSWDPPPAETRALLLGDYYSKTCYRKLSFFTSGCHLRCKKCFCPSIQLPTRRVSEEVMSARLPEHQLLPPLLHTRWVCFNSVFHVAFICLLRFELCNVEVYRVTRQHKHHQPSCHRHPVLMRTAVSVERGLKKGYWKSVLKKMTWYLEVQDT